MDACIMCGFTASDDEEIDEVQQMYAMGTQSYPSNYILSSLLSVSIIIVTLLIYIF